MTDPATPTIRQGLADVTGDQLPKGAASALNQAVDTAQQAQGTQEPGVQPDVTQGSEQNAENAVPTLVPRPRQGPIPLQNEEDNLLFGPTSRPTEAVTTGNLPNGRIPLPPNVNAMIPVLTQAVQDPDAPPQLRGLLQLLMHHMAES